MGSLILKFEAEIKEVKQLKTVSMDNVYSVRFITDDSGVMDLGKLPADSTVMVEVISADKGNYGNSRTSNNK